MTTKQQTQDSPMSAITVVEFERPTLPSETYLSELGEDGPPYTIHGVALGAGDVTKGKSGIKKKWPADELRKAADTLQGTSLVVNHENTAQGVVGKVTKAGYKDGTGVVYEAELYDEDLAEKIEDELLEVSVRGLHADIDSLSEDEESGAIVVEDIEFKNLSIVPSGAAPSNTLQMGEHAELSEAELSAFTEELQEDESDSLEPADWVKWGDKRGIIVSPVEGEEVEVDVYEKVDGKWRSTEETEMVDVSDLEKWDVNEDEEIGAPKDDEKEKSSDEEENADDELGTHEGVVEEGDWVSYDDFDGNKVYGRVIGIQKEEGRRIAKIALWQESDDGWMKVEETAERPSAVLDSWEDHPEPEESSESKDEEEAAAVERGQFVKWKDVDNSWRHGQIIDIDQVGTSMIATLRRFTKAGDKLDETERKPVQGLNKWDWSPDTIKSKESTVRQSEPSESNSGGGVGVDEVVNFLSKFVEENATTTKNVPVDEAQPTHDSMDDEERNLIGDMTIEEFVRGLSHIDSSELSENIDGDISEMTVSELSDRRVEGEEETYESQQELDEAHADSPRYVEDDADELEAKFDGYPEAAQENAQMALDAREETGNPNDCGTDVGWKRAEQLANGEALTREQLGKMSAFARHEQNSEMDDDEGRADCGWMMWKAWGGDEGIEWAQRKLDEIEEEASSDEGESTSDSTMSESSDVEAELQEYTLHEPSWDGTTEQDWDEPALEDFLSEMDTDADSWEDLTEEQKEQIGQHFLISASGFPAENYSDMKLPVVEPSGELNVNALAAVKGGHGAGAVEGLSDEKQNRIDNMMNDLANEEFDRSWGEEENAELAKPMFSSGDWVMWDWSGSTAHGRVEETFHNDGMVTRTIEGTEVEKDSDEQPVYLVKVWDGDEFDGRALRQQGARNLRQWEGHPDEEEQAANNYINGTNGAPTAPTKAVGGVRVLPGDDLLQEYKGASEQDSMTQYKVTTMDEQIEEKLSELDDPVAVEAEELQELQDKADRFEELSENIEAIRERTEILDEVDRSRVEELRDADDPVVVESARYEELQDEAEQVKSVYAASLAEHTPGFTAEELSEAHDIDTLRQKHEDVVGELEEELSAETSEEAEPRSQDPSEEELEDASNEGESEEELSDDVAQKQEEILSKIKEGRL